MQDQTRRDLAAYQARQRYLEMAEARAQEREARRNRPPARPGDELPQSWWDQALRSAGIDLAKHHLFENLGAAPLSQVRELTRSTGSNRRSSLDLRAASHRCRAAAGHA